MWDSVLSYTDWSLPATRAALEVSLQFLAYGVGAFTIFFSIISVIAARKFRLLQLSAPKSTMAPPITILKPIKGTDADMYRNLSSFLDQDYPQFQVLFCLQNPEDPALAILEKLRCDFPNQDIEIIVSKSRIGYNPKVNNLSNTSSFIKHEIIMISDSDIRVGRDFLRRIVSPFSDPTLGLVTCFYKSPRAHGLGGLLEALSVNSQFLPQGLVAGILLRLRFAMGAVMMVRRQAFEACGGFTSLGHHLADDFILGANITAAGYQVEFSRVIVDSVPGFSKFSEHLAHIARWARTIRACQPGGYIGLLALQGFALLTLHLAFFGPKPPTVILWLCVAFVRMASVGWIHLAYLTNPDILIQIPLIPLQDLIQFVAWLSGFRYQRVLWRGEYYEIMVGGRLVPEKRKSLPLTASSSL